MEIDRRDGMTDEQISEFIKSVEVLKDWAEKNVISDGCRDPSNRTPGCLSCDVLHTLEFLDDVVEDYKDASHD